jgi:type I restriction enzyme R subunit
MVDDNQKIREDFYEALTEFGMCLQLALSSRAFFDDGAFDEAQIRTYKRDLKFFTELRTQAKRDAQETVDFSEYEQQIRKMVDTQVIGQDIKDPPGVLPVGTLGADDPESWSDEKTRTEADLIKTRIRKTIEQDLIDDPYAKRVFSELLKDAIRQAEALFEYPNKQFVLFKDLQEQVDQRKTPGVPDRFDGRPKAQSYFGVLRVETEGIEADLTEERMIEEAFHIDETVENAVKTHSINPGNIEGEIRKQLLPHYFKVLGGLEAAKSLIEEIVAIVRAGRTKGAQ